MFGIRDHQLALIANFLKAYPEVERASVFGSRAKGNYKPSSDIDIALFGSGVTAQLAAVLKYRIEETTTIPYFVDFAAYPELTNQDLKDHIDRVGVEFYRRMD
jgi:predicted nucleotidyltransferase